MKRILLLSLFFALSSCGNLAPAQIVSNQSEITITKNDDDSVTIHIPAEQVAMCDEQGGCAVVSRAWMLRTVGQACGVEL